MKKANILGFGEDVEGYNVPVLNEREVRASAGILFVFMLISIMLVVLRHNFLLIKHVIIVFLTDFLIRVFINPKYAPTLIISRLIVSKQTPEYVGAPQKKFAWKIGVALSALMFCLMVVLNSYSIVTGITCFMCLVFLFFEAAFGICLGCLFYGWIYKSKAQHCAGEVCEVTTKHEIQKTSWVQLIIVAACIAYVLLTILFFNSLLSEPPQRLWDMFSATEN